MGGVPPNEVSKSRSEASLHFGQRSPSARLPVDAAAERAAVVHGMGLVETNQNAALRASGVPLAARTLNASSHEMRPAAATSLLTTNGRYGSGVLRPASSASTLS